MRPNKENSAVSKSDGYLMACGWVVLGVLARLIPHPPNMSPLASISIFGGAHLGRKSGMALTLATLMLSDMILALINGHPAFGEWSFFTYSGFAAMVFVGSFLRGSLSFVSAGLTLLGSSLGFWIWTNFGVWAVGAHGLYPKTLEGLIACYGAALPFLGNSLAGDLLWGSAFFLSFHALRSWAPRFGWNIQGA